MNRRQFIAAIAAGGVVTAEGLWMPGRKLISIPKPATGGMLTRPEPLMVAAHCPWEPLAYKRFEQYSHHVQVGDNILVDEELYTVVKVVEH